MHSSSSHKTIDSRIEKNSKPFTTESESAPATSTSDPDELARVQKLLSDAEILKNDGNNEFRAGRWEQALATYKSALGHLPQRKEEPLPQPRRDSEPDPESDEDEEKREKSASKVESAQPPESDVSTEAKSPLDDESAKMRAVLNANIAACYVKLDTKGDHAEVVKACTNSLKDDKDYVKALQRRATANEKLDTWSSLTAAQEDYEKLLTLLPTSSKEHRDAKRALQVVKPRAEAAQKKEMGEMLDKLKGFGNSILGHFGMSTDNFKFEPNGQGGYSINFQQ